MDTDDIKIGALAIALGVCVRIAKRWGWTERSLHKLLNDAWSVIS